MDQMCIRKSFEMRPKEQFMSCCDKQKTVVEKFKICEILCVGRKSN